MGRTLQMENLSTAVPGAMGLLQVKEEGTRKITVSLLSRLVFWIHLRKSLTLFESKAFQWTLLSLPEQRMWPSEPSPLAMEILPIRIRISRFAANFELGLSGVEECRTKCWLIPFPLNKGSQAHPLLPRKSCMRLEDPVWRNIQSTDLDSGWWERGEVTMSLRSLFGWGLMFAF